MATEPFIGEIMVWAGNFAPYGWAFCAGQLLPINQNQALFSLLGTTYGGDGRVTFALPDLRGRVAIGAGQGPGLSYYDLGDKGGVEASPLTEVSVAATEPPPAVPLRAPPANAPTLSRMQPYLPLSYVIALYGIYPSRG